MKLLRKIQKAYRRLTTTFTHQMSVAGIAALVFGVLILGAKTFTDRNNDVYAASGQQEVSSQRSAIPLGITGAINGVMETKKPEDAVKRIGTSCEEVIVGQRRRKVESITTMDASSALEEAVYRLQECSSKSCAQAKLMSDNDYSTLLSIVEAEAGGEDLKGRIMVANVILNRTKDNRFPDTVYDVVWDVVDGAVQFSPTEDGRINSVSVSDITIQAVQAALEGTDYSQGALFFVAKDQADQKYVKWFEKDLVSLFEHGVHTFYTYPEE